MKQILVWICILALGVNIAGCATLRDSILLGVGSGAAGGAAVGAIASSENDGSGMVVGSAIGAVVGGLAAYFVHSGLEKRDRETRKDTLFGLDKFGVQDVPKGFGSIPSVSFKVVEEQKIETHRKGNRVVEGHRIWILSDDSSVQLNEENSSKKDKEI